MGDSTLLDRSMMVDSKGDSIGLGARGSAVLKKIEDEKIKEMQEASQKAQLVVLKEFYRCIKTGEEIEIRRMIKDKYVDFQNINTKHPDDFDCTVLHHAARYDRQTIFKSCLDIGADPNCFNRNKDSILTWCVCNYKRPFIEMLFAHGHPGVVDVEYKSWNDRTALSYADEYGYKDLARLIRKYIADTQTYNAMKAEEALVAELERRRLLEEQRKKEEEEKKAAELMALQEEIIKAAKAEKFAALAKPKKVSKT